MRQVHSSLLIGADDAAKLSTDKADTAAREGRYDGCLEEVAEWTELRSGAITLAPPEPLPQGVVKKPKPPPKAAKRKATAQPATAEPAEQIEDAAGARDAPSETE